MKPRYLGLALFVAGLALAGCSGAQRSPSSGPVMKGGAGSDGVGVVVGARAPGFALPTIDGRKVSLEGLAGKVVLVDFWGSWCGPCGKELPALAALYAKLHAEGLEVVAIDVDTDRAAARQFLADHPLPFTIALDPAGRVPDLYGLATMPSSYVIGRDGSVRWVNSGFEDGDDQKIAAAVRAALGGGPTP